ncbi:FkbM family methyltransferase [Mesorhizobium prunaredense]|uniref:FkbM family methyltransferase n=1 Tax=Mesorhizobium prunaredense TaxID=1631249 RepID=UPI000984A8AC|nr:FkbM family methyltransferase [Mesorhizobium prunaredense]
MRWQIGARLLGQPVIMPFANGARFIAEPGAVGLTGNIYCGLHEFHDMAFLLHFLRSGDVFYDVGANVGSYTLLASAAAGAKTICFEPIPSTFAKLIANVRVNNAEGLVNAQNIGVGNRDETKYFTSNLDTVNRVALDTDSSDAGRLEVKVRTLDSFSATTPPTLIKIDVEGFETEVLDGARQTLSHPELRGMIVELNEGGKTFGHDNADIEAFIRERGFAPYSYDPFTRKLTPYIEARAQDAVADNKLFLRDVNFVSERVSQAAAISVVGFHI